MSTNFHFCFFIIIFPDSGFRVLGKPISISFEFRFVQIHHNFRNEPAVGLKEIDLLTKTILTENNRTAEGKKGFLFYYRNL